eukprot:g4519.t1
MGCFICKTAAPVDNTTHTSPELTESDRASHQASLAGHKSKGGRSLLDGHETSKSYSEAEGNWDECNTVFVLDDVDATQSLDILKDAVVDTNSSSIVERAFQNSLRGSNNKTPREGRQDSSIESEKQVQETSSLRIEKIKGCMFVNQYLIIKYLGRGSCGKVFLCLNVLDFKLYAMKSVRKSDLQSSRTQGNKRNLMDDLKREILIMKKMKHSNIVTLSEVIDDPSGSKLLLVMEYLEGGPIMTRESLAQANRLSESLVFRHFRHMVQALDYLHSQRVVHGDLKPENVLISANGEVKLSDFGCSKVIVSGNEYLERCNGTPAFLAPEMMKPNTRYRGTPTDIYAMGVCLYTLVYGRIPFRASNLYQLFQVVQNEEPSFPEEVQISSSLKDLLKKVLIKNPKERIKLSEIFEHPWVTNNGLEPLPRACEKPKTELQFNKQNYSATLQEIIVKLSTESTTEERVFNEGEYLIKQGDSARSLLIIVSGDCEVLLNCYLPRRSGRRHRKNPIDPTTTNALLNSSDSASSVTPVEEEMNAKKVLLDASLKAHDFVQKQTRDENTILIGCRSAGDVVGEMGLFTRDAKRTASVRAVSKVLVKIIHKQELFDYITKFPEAQQSLKELVWKKESENMILDGLFQLGSVHEQLAVTYDQISCALTNIRGC